MKKIFTIIIAVLLLIPYLHIALGEPSAPPGITNQGSESRDLAELSSFPVSAQGGNITALDIDALSISNSWQGYYGNISGGIALDDANNNTFYNWSVGDSSPPSGEVYATRNDTINWVSVNCTNVTERATEEAALGQNTNDSDSVMNTFNTTTHPAFFVGSASILQDTCFSTNVNTNGAPDSNRFHQILLSDGTVPSNIIYSTIIDADQLNYEGALTDFQLLVGEDEHDGGAGPTTYYIWVELN